MMFKGIVPKNPKQQLYVDALRKPQPYIVIASGSAGSGKTLLATSVGVEKLKEGVVDRLILTRPTVSVGDELGFLPGDLQAKMEPWIRPLYDAMSYYYPRSKIEKMMKDGIVEIAPLTFMRGRTFEKSWIICDEAQNTTIDQMLMTITRIGDNSKMVITGDPLQHDRGFDVNGLTDLINKLDYNSDNNDDFFRVVEFEEDDVERHPIIPYILRMYK
jgi:phosphate starvation-inducible protein PhoH and related proteins